PDVEPASELLKRILVERRRKWEDTNQGKKYDATEAVAAINGELDLCFEAGEEDLARSQVKRKLVAEQQLKQATQQLDSIDREHDTLSVLLIEQRQTLADTQQKAELLADAGTQGFAPATETGISRDDIEVAFLKEKHRRQS
ncbi:MAG: hypothetical protein ACC642_08730, partial [Pseudomonadales bacterium]